MPSGSSAKYLVTVSAHGTTKVCELDAREPSVLGILLGNLVSNTTQLVCFNSVSAWGI